MDFPAGINSKWTHFHACENPEHGAWCPVKVTLSSELEGCWEIESHSETKCEKSNPERKRVAVEGPVRRKQMRFTVNNPWFIYLRATEVYLFPIFIFNSSKSYSDVFFPPSTSRELLTSVQKTSLTIHLHLSWSSNLNIVLFLDGFLN